MRQGSAPNFAPPVEEGMVFFFPLDEQTQVGSSGEVLILEVTELDDEGQPCAFELLDDEAVAQDIFDEFKQATCQLYDFS